MSATRAFAPLTAHVDLTTISAYVNNSAWGYQDAERTRQALDMALYLAGHLDMGGDDRPVLSSSYVPVNGARSFDLNGDTLGGLTLEAVIFYFTTDASTTVNVRVRNTTDSSDAGAIASASAATTLTREVITLTLATGVKTYQLQVTGSDALNGVAAYAYMRLRKVPA